MSTLRVSNIEAKADVSSPSVNEKVKVTNSNGELLVHIDGATLGITTVGINTSGESVRFDSNQNVTFFGDITGTGLDINGNADISGNLNVGGVLTYEDVTNIDSVGIITARSGINVTGGSVGVATESPSYRVDIGDGASDPANGHQLRINAAGDYIFALQKQSAASFSIRNNSTGVVHLNTQNSKRLALGVSSAGTSGSIEEQLSIVSSGKIGINDTSPAYQLSINGTGAVRNEIVCTDNNAAGAGVYFRTMNGSSIVSNATIRTDNTGNLQIFSGASTDAERLRIDSSGNAILKSANAAFKAENPNSSGDYLRMYAGSGTSQWDIYTNGELLRMGDNSSSATAKVQFDNPTLHRSTATTVGVAALTAKQESNNGGYLIFDGKNSSDTTVFSVTHNGRVKVTDGIDFSSNANTAGMSSEILDDYEEGTWTATLAASGGGLVYTTSNNLGYYTKIGDVVHVWWYSSTLNISNNGVGYALVRGLPFSSTSATQYYGVASTAHNTAFTPAADGGFITLNSSDIVFQPTGSTNSSNWVQATGRYLMIHAVYKTA